jgi:hypothetical protein
MFADNITIADAAAANKTFAKISQSGNESVRIDTATTLADPRTMVIRHTTTGKGDTLSDRHNVLFIRKARNAAGVEVSISCSVAETVPRDETLAAEVDDLAAFALNWYGVAGNRTALRRGES